MLVQPAEETLFYGYQAATMYGCQIYGQMNPSMGPRPSTMSRTRSTSGSDAGDTLNSLLHHVDNTHETRSDPVSQNQPPQRSLPTQSTEYGLHADQNGNYLKCSNRDGISSAPCHEESSGRNTQGCGSRDPRKSRSLLYGRGAGTRGGSTDDPEAKKARLELTLQVDSRTNYRGKTIFTTCVAKPAKVMFSKASVCSTLGGVTSNESWDRSHGHGGSVPVGGGVGVSPPTEVTTPD